MENRLILRAHCDSAKGMIKGAAPNLFPIETLLPIIYLHAGAFSKLLYGFAPGIFLFDLILYVHSTIFQLCGTVLPGFNQY